jgi:hypothetical protein
MQKQARGGGPVGRDGVGVGPDDVSTRVAERWVIEWGNDTEVGYRRKLDHFGIYLGAVRDRSLVGAVRGFEAAKHEASANPPSLWFVHRDGVRTELDRKLLAAAGLKLRPTDVVAQFFPRELQAVLASLETGYSHKNVSQIQKTVFGIRPAGAGYEFFVIEQQLK